MASCAQRRFELAGDGVSQPNLQRLELLTHRSPLATGCAIDLDVLAHGDDLLIVQLHNGQSIQTALILIGSKIDPQAVMSNPDQPVASAQSGTKVADQYGDDKYCQQRKNNTVNSGIAKTNAPPNNRRADKDQTEEHESHSAVQPALPANEAAPIECCIAVSNDSHTTGILVVGGRSITRSLEHP